MSDPVATASAAPAETSTIRQALEAKIAASNQAIAGHQAQIAEAQGQLQQLPPTFLDKMIADFHKLIGWL
jgi:hypothetical protein